MDCEFSCKYFLCILPLVGAAWAAHYPAYAVIEERK